MLEEILAKEAAMFLPGVPIVKYSGNTELNYSILQEAFKEMNPKIILIERDSANNNQKFSLLVGNNYKNKVDFKVVFEFHEGITFITSYFIHANQEAMLESIGLGLINLLKKI